MTPNEKRLAQIRLYYQYGDSEVIWLCDRLEAAWKALAEREEQCRLADANVVKWQDRFEELEKESEQAVAAERVQAAVRRGPEGE